MMREKPVASVAALAALALILTGDRLEARRPMQTTATTTPPWDANCVTVEVPVKVFTDQIFTGKITVKNTGSLPWTSIPYAGEPNPQPECCIPKTRIATRPGEPTSPT